MRTKRIHEDEDDIEYRVGQLAEELSSIASSGLTEFDNLKSSADSFRSQVDDDYVTSDTLFDTKADVKDAIRGVSEVLRYLKRLYKELEVTSNEYVGYAMRRDMGDDYLR